MKNFPKNMPRRDPITFFSSYMWACIGQRHVIMITPLQVYIDKVLLLLLLLIMSCRGKGDRKLLQI